MERPNRPGTTPMVTRLARRTLVPAERISLTSAQRLLLSYLDQPTSLENLVLMLGLEETKIQKVLDELRAENLIEWIEIRRATSMVPSSPKATAISMIPEEDTSDLPKEQRAIVEQAFAKLGSANHYEMLGVSQ